MGSGQTAHEPGIETAVMDAGFGKFIMQLVRTGASGAKPIGNYIDAYSASRSPLQRSLDFISGRGDRKNIGFEIDLSDRRIACSDQRREKFGAAMLKSDVIVRGIGDRSLRACIFSLFTSKA